MAGGSRPVEIRYEGNLIKYICPRCRCGLVFHKKKDTNACMLCGQKLDWDILNSLIVEIIRASDSDEAAWIANTWYNCCGIKDEERIDIDDWRHQLRDEGTELYLLFKNRKSHGAFMRKYSKEGIVLDG